MAVKNGMTPMSQRSRESSKNTTKSTQLSRHTNRCCVHIQDCESRHHLLFLRCAKTSSGHCMHSNLWAEHTHSHNSWIPLGGVVNSVKRCLRSAQKYSMGFKSIGCASHWNSWNACDANLSCTLLLVCLESLSYWNTNLLGSRSNNV